jgi:RNA polymerase sigma-70 factor, ECF subfamily
MDRSPPPPSFEALFQAHFDYVRLLARLAGVPAPDAEDLAQSVFLVLFLAMGQGHFDPSASARPWLKATTYRMARDYLKRRSHQERPAAKADFCDRTDEAMNAEQRFGLNQQWNAMLDLLQALDPERRIILVMHEIEEMTTFEIADMLGLSPNTVSTRLRLARKDFAAAVRRKRAQERRTLREMIAVVVPLDASAILRTARDLPVPEAPAEVRSGVWERLRRVTDALEPVQPTGLLTPLPPLAPRVPPLAPWLPLALPITLPVAKLAAALLTSALLGAGASAAALAARDRPPSTPTVNVDRDVPVASAFADSSAMAPVPPPLTDERDATTAAPPRASATPGAGGMVEPVDTDAAERLLLQRARAALDPGRPDPAEALRLLHRYDDTYSGSVRFTKERERLGHAALALQRSARGREP